MRDRADDPAGRAHGPGGEGAGDRRPRGRDRACRELAAAEELSNVAFEHADAQVYRFPDERFDLAISRFGTMFFDDPAAAFANIRQALRPTGRLVMMVWQAPAATNGTSLSARLSACPRHRRPRFRWTGSVLARRPVGRDRGPGDRGFVGVAFADVSEPVYYGQDVAAALDWVRGFTCTSQALNRLDPAAAASAVRRLREVLAAHHSGDGVWFNSAPGSLPLVATETEPNRAQRRNFRACS